MIGVVCLAWYMEFSKTYLDVLIFSVQFSSVAQSCPTLCDPMNCSTPGLPVHHQLPEFTQTHVHWVSDAIQPSHPRSSPPPPAPNPSQGFLEKGYNLIVIVGGSQTDKEVNYNSIFSVYCMQSFLSSKLWKGNKIKSHGNLINI